MESTHKQQSQQQSELQKRLWEIANDLRGNMDASEFRNYILGLVFYRFLSERVQLNVDQLLVNEQQSFAEVFSDPAKQKKLIQQTKETLGFFLQPKSLFESLVKQIRNGTFQIGQLQTAIDEIQASTIGQGSEEDFRGLFEDMDLTSSKLGATSSERGALISKVMLNLSDIDFHENMLQIDVLGDAYEYLISQFAATAGKKAGEFYTPQQVSKVLAQLVTLNRSKVSAVYDPTMGSGSLLLRVGDYAKVDRYFGQELNSTTYNLARMNLLMHGVNYKRFDLRQGDTLENDRFIGQSFDAVVANPPYSAHWNMVGKLKDPRFAPYKKLAPKSKADFAFLEHMLYHLKPNGTMAVVLPHGVLFRGAAEATIRRLMIERDNVLDAVIGLPANLFFGTSIPTVVLVLKKNRTNHNVLIVNASKLYAKGKNHNTLTDANVHQIVSAYQDWQERDKFSHIADFDELKRNDFNLSIPRYIDTFEPARAIDVDQLVLDMRQTNQRATQSKEKFAKILGDLRGQTPEAEHELNKIKEYFNHD